MRQLRQARTGRLAFAVSFLALALMFFSALATSSGALERASSASSFVTASFGGASAEIMRPTLTLEARTMALFTPARSDCSPSALHAEVWGA